MKKIKFSKFNGQGNDFIIIDATAKKINLSKKIIKEMCSRNFGIGGDGLIMIKKSKNSDLRMDYYNRDGSAAEMCGNGIRCMAAFIYNKNLIRRKYLNIETPAGEKSVSIDIEKNKIKNLSVDMGTPEFKPENIPVKIKDKSDIFSYKIEIEQKIFHINCVSMGNPHCVIFLEKDTDLKSYDVARWGSKIENLNIFPRKTNVEFVKIKNRRELDVRIWERGVGETMACGTGACAAGICAMKINKDIDGRITVNLPGGKLDIIWNPVKSKIFLKGTVEHSFDGEYYL